MADLISGSATNVYLKVHMPRELFESLMRTYSNEPRAMREVRRRWEMTLERLRDELPRRVP